MTTKLKIIAGFLIMIILIGGVAAFGYHGVEHSSDGFKEYRKQSYVGVSATNLMVDLGSALSRTYDFVSTYDTTQIDKALEHIDTYATKAGAAKKTTAQADL